MLADRDIITTVTAELVILMQILSSSISYYVTISSPKDAPPIKYDESASPASATSSPILDCHDDPVWYEP